MHSILAPARLLVQFAGLLAQPFRADPPRRRQQMGMMVALVALATWCVDRHVHRHPMPLADLPREAQRKLAPRLGRQLGRKRDFIFTGDGGVLARLGLLGGVPERGPVVGDARRKIILGGLLLDAAMKDPAWESRLNDLMNRISRDQDRKAFEGWTFKGGPADA